MSMHSRFAPYAALWLGLSLGAITSLAACQRPTSSPQTAPDMSQAATPTTPPTTSAPKTVGEPVVLARAGEHNPSYLKMKQGESFDHKVFSESQSCAQSGCHAQIVTEWRESMHAFASLNNPLYRVSFEDFVKDADTQKVKFCGGCHDVALMFDGAISKPVIEPTHEAAYAGITCNACHGITEASPLGNASYTLTTSEIPIPKPNDDKSLADHKARVGSTALRTNALCVSCHRGFLTPESGHSAPLEGLVEWTQWRGSAYNGVQLERIDPDLKEQNCTSCHMPRAEDGHASHRFPGGHSSFAAMIGSQDQLKAQTELLTGAATIDIMPLNAQSFDKDGELELDVVVFNERTGHTFPAGARDLRDTWLEVDVLDAQGKLLARSGAAHAEQRDDREAHRFYLHQANKEGQAQIEHNVAHFRTPVFDSTIAPRDAAAIRFKWSLPQDLKASGQPLQINARLQHRRISLTMQERVCEDYKQPRGQAFAQQSLKLNGFKPDPCVALPIIEIDRASLWVGAGAQEKTQDLPELPQWRRLYRYGLALQHQVQENLEETQRAFAQAMDSLPADAQPLLKSMILVEQAQVTGRQGRTDEAIALYAQARALTPDHPAIAYGEAMAYMQVWRFEDAVASLSKISDKVNNDRVWRQLAIAYGSLSQHEQSLLAAQRGLALEPRDSHMLRSQLLAYRQLNAKEEWVNQASQAFDIFKRDTDAPGIKSKCSSTAEWCRLERIPVHTHTLISTP